MQLAVGELPDGAEFRTVLTRRLGTVISKVTKRKERAVEAIIEPLGGQGLGETVWLHPEVKVEVLK